MALLFALANMAGLFYIATLVFMGSTAMVGVNLIRSGNLTAQIERDGDRN